ncbi:hypothetical protein ACFLYT_00830 [Nanoarchaeota archaeon]
MKVNHLLWVLKENQSSGIPKKSRLSELEDPVDELEKQVIQLAEGKQSIISVDNPTDNIEKIIIGCWKNHETEEMSLKLYKEMARYLGNTYLSSVLRVATHELIENAYLRGNYEIPEGIRLAKKESEDDMRYSEEELREYRRLAKEESKEYIRLAKKESEDDMRLTKEELDQMFENDKRRNKMVYAILIHYKSGAVRITVKDEGDGFPQKKYDKIMRRGSEPINGTIPSGLNTIKELVGTNLISHVIRELGGRQMSVYAHVPQKL